MRKIKLNKNERIISIVPEYVGGPGWNNQVAWVHIYDGAKDEYSYDCLQPEELSPEMWVLFEAAAAMHKALLKVVPTERTSA